MTVIIVLMVTVTVLVIGFGVLQRLHRDPERALHSWDASQIDRFHGVTDSPEHLIYVQVAAEPIVHHQERLIEALGRPAPGDLRSDRSRVVEDALIGAILTWATGCSATEIQDAGSSGSLTRAYEAAAESVGLRISMFEILAAAALDDPLRNLAGWRVNGAYYDRGDGKIRSDNLNAAVVELDARGVGQIMVRSRPRGGSPTFRPSMEVVDNPALAVEVFAEAAGFGRTQYRSFEEIRRGVGGDG